MPMPVMRRRHRFKRHKDLWGETIGRMARPHRPSAAAYAGRQAHRDLPGDLFGRHLQELWRLCPPRDAVIGFPAHGAWRQVEAATAARDVPVGQSWAFHDHRTMAEVIAAETKQPDAFTLQISRSGGSRQGCSMLYTCPRR